MATVFGSSSTSRSFTGATGNGNGTRRYVTEQSRAVVVALFNMGYTGPMFKSLLATDSRASQGLLTVLSVLLTVPSSLAQQPLAKLPEFTAATTEKALVRGQMISLAKTGSVKFSDPAITVAEGSLISLRRADRPWPSWPRGPQVI